MSSQSLAGIYEALHALDNAFDHLMQRLNAAIACYARTLPPTWMFDSELTPAAWFEQALMDLWYLNGQDGRETRNYIGIVAAEPELLYALEQVNAAKSRFSMLLQHVKSLSPAHLSEARHRLAERHPDIDTLLQRNGLARLHLKQCWRHIPIAEASVARVRFAWYSSGRSIKRLSVGDAEQKLLKLDTQAPHVQIQLRKLASLPSGEMLAQVQPQAPLMRANLFFTEPLEDGHTRRALNVALPLIVPATQRGLPHLKYPPTQPPSERTRARRRDEKIEAEPFLPSLRIHRYR